MGALFVQVVDKKQRRIQRKKGALYVGHHGWSKKKSLVLRWSKKAKITLDIVSFLQNIYFSIFKSSPVLNMMDAWRWNLISFSKFTNVFIRKEKNTAVNKKRKIEKNWTLFYNSCFIKSFKATINHFFFKRFFCSQDFFLVLQACLRPKLRFLISGWCKKYQKGKLGTTNS